ncbi:endospore germination permease [Fictibacillus nanhaiensis]|uniref:GerAB/ArcD/ProY family transporter n=1 Tax=Fictibacillus nanhaiensis TaxID=742169 RepID=UPI002E20C3AF|nr:endospore germination permease [Fictibacillus nanhaiensis]MED1864624.1 endospore germination permease [Fictibacillus nanhaiensis]
MRIQSGISPLHIYFLIILSSGLINHVLIIPVILSASGRDAWVSIMLSVLPYIVFILLIGSVLKKLGNQNFLDYLKIRLGPIPYYLLSGVFIIYFFFNAGITFRDTITWTQTNYLMDTPSLALGLLLGVLCFFGTNKGLQELSIVAMIALPLVVSFGLFIAFGNIQHKDYSMLLPITEHGWSPVLNGCVYVLSGLTELCTLLFLVQHTKKTLKWKHVFIVEFILVGLMIGPTMAAIAEFGPYEANKLRYPAFEQWKLLTISKEITRMDFLSIFQWISGAFIRVSLLIFLVAKLTGVKKHRTWLVASLYILLIVYTLAPISNISIFNFLYDFFFPIQMYVILPLVSIICIYVLIKK